jgi:polyisoprenoid-binding protein YceI
VPRFDQESAECLVFTKKEGLLSAVAHDLKVRVGRFTVEVGEGPDQTDPKTQKISARLDARSLQVVCAMREGAEDPALLSASDRQKIERNIVEDVLHAARYPEVRFEGQAEREGDGYVVTGQLSLHGVSKPLRVKSRAEGGRQVAEVVLHQPDFGIKPYSAMLGALKVQADLRVRIAIPWGG